MARAVSNVCQADCGARASWPHTIVHRIAALLPACAICGAVPAAPIPGNANRSTPAVYLPSFYRGYQPPAAGSVMLMFAGVGKQVPFVVAAIAAIGQHPDKAVVIVAVFLLYYKAAGDDRLFLLCHAVHPLHCFAIPVFRQKAVAAC